MNEDKSHLTAVARTTLSAPIRKLIEKGCLYVGQQRILDYGCGRGFDADKLGFDKYDPYFFPTKPTGEYDVVVCNYVLNVIPSPRRRAQVLEDIRGLLAPGGKAYVTVRRHVETDGWTSKGTWQSSAIVVKGRSILKMSKYEIYEIGKE